MKVNYDGIYKTTELTDEEQLSSCILSAQTVARLENEIAVLTETLVGFHFAIGDPELNRQLADFLYKQARRETLIAMLDDCADAYRQIANPNQPTGD